MESWNARTAVMLGEAVARLRHRHGWTQAELAARADVSRAWVVRLESGERGGMEISRIRKVLDALGAHFTITIDPDFDPNEDEDWAWN